MRDEVFIEQVLSFLSISKPSPVSTIFEDLNHKRAENYQTSKETESNPPDHQVRKKRLRDAVGSCMVIYCIPKRTKDSPRKETRQDYANGNGKTNFENKRTPSGLDDHIKKSSQDNANISNK